jgi:hypothetical protein
MLFPSPASFAPEALLSNYGVLSQLDNFLVSCRITHNGTQVYFDTTRVPSYVGAPGLISFARKFRPDKKGIYRIRFQSFLPGDQEPVNDSLSYQFQVGRAHDQQALEIRKPEPGAVLGIGSGPHRIWAVFRNNGFKKSSGLVPYSAQIWKDGNMLYYSIRSTTLDTGETRLILFDSSFVPTLPGIHQVKVFVSDVEDPYRENDTITSSFVVEKEVDVAVDSITMPAAGSVFRVKQDAVKATAFISNQGKKSVQTPFQTAFEIRDPLNRLVFARYVSDTLGLNERAQRMMNDSFIPNMPGRHRLWVFTRLITDQYRLNDTQYVDVQANATVDISAAYIEAPNVSQEFPIPGGTAPSVWLKNYGSGLAPPQTKVYFHAFDSANGGQVWAQEESAPIFNTGDSVLVTSSVMWNINQAKTYLLRFVVAAPGDVYQGNDTLYAYLRAVDPLRVHAMWDAAFVLKPNPAQQEVQVLMPFGAVGSLRLNDAAGRVLLHLKPGVQTIDLRSYGNGVYFLHWDSPYGSLVKRLLKE